MRARRPTIPFAVVGLRAFQFSPSEGQSHIRKLLDNGTITHEMLDDVPNQRIITRIVDRDLDYAGLWTYALSSSGNSTTLQVTENGEVSNPMFRFMSRSSSVIPRRWMSI